MIRMCLLVVYAYIIYCIVILISFIIQWPLELYYMVRLPEILRHYPKNSKGSEFYKSLYNLLISVVTHY